LVARFGPKQTEKWRTAIYLLRKHCPTQLRVRKVSRVSDKSPHLRDRDGKRTLLAAMQPYSKIRNADDLIFADIYIRNTLSFQHSIDLLIHEWAHAMLAPIDKTIGEDHGPTWGVAYARCYQVVKEPRECGIGLIQP
jgi:hypothetical protein